MRSIFKNVPEGILLHVESEDCTATEVKNGSSVKTDVDQKVNTHVDKLQKENEAIVRKGKRFTLGNKLDILG